MSSHENSGAGASPNYDFTVAEIADYDPELVAEIALWPLADGLWRGNWRVDSLPGEPLVFPKSGFHKGEWVGVYIMAEVVSEPFEVAYGPDGRIDIPELSYEDDDEEELDAAAQEFYIEEETVLPLKRVSLTVERQSDESLVHLVRQAWQHSPATVSHWTGEGDYDEDHELDESLLSQDLRVHSVAIYIHDTLGRSDSDHYLSLRDLDDTEIWNNQGLSMQDDELSGEEGMSGFTPLGDADLDNMEAAAVVLGGPKRIVRNLEALRAGKLQSSD